MHKRNPKHNTQSGFTLIETLVAIFILLISITGPMSFAQSGLRASFVARDQVVAFYLAQDAIETIKNIRDNSSLMNEGWLDDLDPQCLSDAGPDYKPCEIQTSSNGTLNYGFLSCGNSGDTCPPMDYDVLRREFELSNMSEEVSKFSRTIFLNKLTDNELQIIVEVSWDTQFLTERRIVVQENIYNWVPQYTNESSTP